jgi:deoxyhypusine synthase
MARELGPVSRFLKHNYRHFNAAALVDAAEGWNRHLTTAGRCSSPSPGR